MKKNNLFNSITSIFVSFGIVFAVSSCEIGLGEAVDIEAPTVEVLSPVPTGSVPKEFNVKGTVSDNIGVTELTVSVVETNQQFKWDGAWKIFAGGEWKAYDKASFSGDEKSFNWSVTLSVDGAKSGESYTLLTSAKDLYENESGKSQDERSFIVDVSEPVVSITLPALISDYTKAKDANDSYNLKDSQILTSLINRDFIIEGSQKEDTHLDTLTVRLDTGTEDTVLSSKIEPDFSKVSPDPVIVKSIEGSRSWSAPITENELPEVYRSGKHLFRLVTESCDLAGNTERKVHGWFTYWNEADRPWISATFGDDSYKDGDQQIQVYPSCALQGQAYDDDGIKQIEIYTYIYEDGNWNLVNDKTQIINLEKENCPTYYAWSVNAIADNKHFKIVAKCIDKFNSESAVVERFLSIADVNPPKIEITSPLNGSTEIGNAAGNITITGIASDDGSLLPNPEKNPQPLTMVRIANSQRQNIIPYFDGEDDGWKTEKNGNKLFKIDLVSANGTDEPEGGYFNYTFSKTFNIFEDFGINETEIIKSSVFLFKIRDLSGSSTILSYSLQGDAEEPRLTIEKVYVKHANGTTEDYDISNGNQPTLKTFERDNAGNITDKIYYTGTWSDNSASLWTPVNTKIGAFVLESKGTNDSLYDPKKDNKFDILNSTNGTWKSKEVTPNDAGAGSVTARLTDWGGNEAKASASYFISSSKPVIVRISSENPDGSYKTGDTIKLIMEFNKRVTFTGDGAILNLNNGTTARYADDGTNGSSKHTYLYTVGSNESENISELNVNSINKNGSVWKDADKNEIDEGKSTLTIGSLNLIDVRTIKIDINQPLISMVKAITGAGNYNRNKELFFSVEFNKDVSFEKLSDVILKLKVGTKVKELTNPSMTSSKTILYKYTVEGNENGDAYGDNGEITFDSFDLNGTKIWDNAKNELVNCDPQNTDLAGRIIDTTKPNAPAIDIPESSTFYYALTGANKDQPIEIDVTGYEQAAGTEKYYSVDDGTTWISYTDKIKLSTNGTYKIKAYQVDVAGNRSDESVLKLVTLDIGNILTSITSSKPDSTYTTGTKIDIKLNFRKPVHITNSRLKLNITHGSEAVYTETVSDAGSGENGVTQVSYEYTIRDGDSCIKLDVLKIEFDKIEDKENPNNIKSYVVDGNNAPLVDDTTKLSANREIAIVTGNPKITGVNITDKKLTINYNSSISKGSGKEITIKMNEGTFIAPAVMDKDAYNDCSSDIQAYYTEGTNGSIISSGSLKSDLSAKYILDYDTSVNDTTLTGYFVAAKKDTVTIPVDSTAVTVNDTKVEVDISDAYKLPVKGAAYTIDVPAGFVINVLGKDSEAIPDTLKPIRAPGVEKPAIRIKKSAETISDTTVTQPWQANAKIDCQTPGAVIKYANNSKTSNNKEFNGSVIARDTKTDITTATDVSDITNEYTTELTLGTAGTDTTNRTKGYKVLISAVANLPTSVTGESTARVSEPSYETAYRTVVIFVESKNLDDYRWIRGGDAPSGGVSTPNFPFSWNKNEYDKVRAMTKMVTAQDGKSADWYWVSWNLNTTAYVGFLKGDMPGDAATKGPSWWIWGSCAWVGLKSDYPVYPGESVKLKNSGPESGRGAFGYQSKHRESR